MPNVQMVQRRPTLHYGQRGAPFGRKAWDNPVKYKLNRAYGDEFEHADFNSLQRRWNLRSAVAADFEFPGGSSINWKPSGAGSAIYHAIPSGDFEAVLEYQANGNSGGGMFPALFIVDSAGTGFGFSAYSDGGAYAWQIIGWVYSSTGTGLGAGSASALGDGRHGWISVKKSGTSFSGRISTDGSTWSSFTTTYTLSNPAYLAIGQLIAGTTSWVNLHRFNVYSGPTFFPG